LKELKPIKIRYYK